MEILTISLPISTVARKVLGVLSRLTICLKPVAFLTFLRRSLTLLSEKKAVSDEEKKPEKDNNTIIAESFI